jgi:hypothetical protein
VVPSGATPAIPSLHKVQGEPSTTTQDEAPPAAKMPPAPLDKTARSSTAEEPLSEELEPIDDGAPRPPQLSFGRRRVLQHRPARPAAPTLLLLRPANSHWADACAVACRHDLA